MLEAQSDHERLLAGSFRLMAEAGSHMGSTIKQAGFKKAALMLKGNSFDVQPAIQLLFLFKE